ncbi:MAG: type II toxin-antitoxin system HipA family toxin [Deltaproteobacteria bacterium]|nr:type II toxin-antitoxin system HipA family toxin [Deltaproteobacteria bacterium]
MSPRASRPTREHVEVVLDADFLPQACPVGTLFHAAGPGGGLFSFASDRTWLTHPSAFELDPQLQLHGSESYPAGAASSFGIFVDSAPDRWGRLLMERRETLRARQEGRRPRVLGDWDFLLGVHDSCRLGALRFRRDGAAPFLDDDSAMAAPPLTCLRELEAAAQAIEDPQATQRRQFSQWLGALLAPGSSLGGARPKANFTDKDGTLWIAKFPSREDRRDVGAWEALTHDLARDAGIDVPPARMLGLAGRYRTFACRRFDRTAAGRRRFFVSAMTLLARSDGEGGSYLDLAEFLSTRGSTRHKAVDLRQLWSRVVFNILVSNTDDHLRNHGFILESDGWRLAPAYDVNPNVDRQTHALAIDATDPSSDLELARATARYYGVKAAQADRLIEAIASAVATWSARAKASRLPRAETELMAAAFKADR